MKQPRCISYEPSYIHSYEATILQICDCASMSKKVFLEFVPGMVHAYVHRTLPGLLPAALPDEHLLGTGGQDQADRVGAERVPHLLLLGGDAGDARGVGVRQHAVRLRLRRIARLPPRHLRPQHPGNTRGGWVRKVEKGFLLVIGAYGDFSELTDIITRNRLALKHLSVFLDN